MTRLVVGGFMVCSGPFFLLQIVLINFDLFE